MAMANRRTAPSTIFTTSKLSPRQVALKAMNLGCKKLERDDRRSRPQYNVRERLLLCNTISQAEEVLNKRKGRTNRRVMAAEEEEGSFDANSSRQEKNSQLELYQQHKQYIHEEHHSPLRDNSETAEDLEDDIPSLASATSSLPSTRPSSPMLDKDSLTDCHDFLNASLPNRLVKPFATPIPAL
ncbi:hypothetical protein DM01DRAFT_1335322 [Hesseltinella vesiculosa]|uniref:Uncharacterized protein n=1 Tax=Hesseltinella vesiculosa TaxID=101127 RepID=A0A1X2GJ53_9FUNG|nr:hypothetical protein DM01DRAFT_1335322 [Hesseltinella vesiculosa]